jgi:acyl-coenzyme A thioesterase PaaI-like protein
MHDGTLDDGTLGPAAQDLYPDDLAHCYGCGRLNEHGLHIKSRWDGDETVAVYTPREYHMAIPGFVYGGLVASVIDCHGTGSAALAGYRAEGRDLGSEPPLRYVTASLHVDFLKPTPLGVPLQARGRIAEVKGRKVVVDVTLRVGDLECARGRVIAVQLPAGMGLPAAEPRQP